MNPIPELAPHLKQLRLSGILDSLEARNRQAIDSKLAYTEFLALLIQLRQVVAVIAGDQQLLAVLNQATRPTSIAVPQDSAGLVFSANVAVPAFYIAVGVFDVQELSCAPQRSFRIVGVTVDGRHLRARRSYCQREQH